MTSKEKTDSAIDRLLFLKGLAMQSDFYLVDGWSVEEAFKEVSEALHSVEAEKEPDAYMDSWEYSDFKRTGVGTVFNTHEHMGKAIPFYLQAVCNQAEKEPEWVSLENRLPSMDDEDMNGTLWVFGISSDGEPYIERMNSHDVDQTAGDKYWMPTGLRRPAPPEHKPE